MDTTFQNILAVDSNTAFNFFSNSVREVLEAKKYNTDEMLYVTSILAHYSQTSRVSEECMPVFSDLGELSQILVTRNVSFGDLGLELVEVAGSQIVLFAGFFRDQMIRQYNVQTYDKVGQSIFGKLAEHVHDVRRREFFGRLTGSLPMWLIVCRDTHRLILQNRIC